MDPAPGPSDALPDPLLPVTGHAESGTPATDDETQHFPAVQADRFDEPAFDDDSDDAPWPDEPAAPAPARRAPIRIDTTGRRDAESSLRYRDPYEGGHDLPAPRRGEYGIEDHHLDDPGPRSGVVTILRAIGYLVVLAAVAVGAFFLVQVLI